MTFKKLQSIINKNNIPKDVHIVSDSGWECGPSEMNGVYYNKAKNEIVFTQSGDKYDAYHKDKDWKRLHGED